LYDLHVFLVLRNEGWRLACEYNTDLYEAATITRLLTDFKTLLEISCKIRIGPYRHSRLRKAHRWRSKSVQQPQERHVPVPEALRRFPVRAR